VWRRLAPLIVALLCAASAFGFNSNSPGGSVAGGTCTGGQFMSGITSAGVPVCSTPSGGAPFPPGSPPQIGGFSAVNTAEAQTVGGDLTFARTGANALTGTVTRINGGIPGGTCPGNQFVNVISISGAPTCANLPAPAAGSITDAMLANAYSGVGACAAGSVATTLNRNAAPTCTAISTLGSGVWLPVNNPTFTGALTGPNASFSGTVTLPDASTISSAGLNNVLALGIGAAAPAPGSLIQATYNANAGASIALTNTNTGTSAAATYYATNGPHYMSMQMEGINGATSLAIGDAAILSTTGANGLHLISSGIDALDINSAGGVTLPNPARLGIGVVAPTGANMLVAEDDGNFNTAISLQNKGTGANAYTTYYLGNDLGHFGAIQLSNTGSSGSGYPADSYTINSNSANGIYIATAGAPVHINDTISQAIAPASQINFDASNTTVSLANGANVALALASGLVVINDRSISGDSCLYMTGGGALALIGQSAATAFCEVGTAPTAGKMSMGFNGTNYAVYNNLGGAAIIGVMSISLRAAN
jgi:hypothetical protein